MSIKEQKNIFYELLCKWNNAYNLVQANTIHEFESRHWDDSCQLAQFLPVNSRILDVGSGAGFPGIVLAMHGYDVTLSEINEKKRIFLKEAIRACALTKVKCIADVYKATASYDIVVSRAFSNLTNLLDIMFFVSRETYPPKGIFLKGESYSAELTEAKKKYSFNEEIVPSMISAKGVILIIENLKLL